MKLIEPKVEIIPQQAGLSGVYKQIEIAGRTCYKSEDKITTDSATDFVAKMISNGHTAMLEHGTVYLTVPPVISYNGYLNNAYSKVNKIDDMVYITTNLRVIVENNWLDDLRYSCVPTMMHEPRITVRFTCDRGVSHELVRHRTFSFAMESTRQWRH